MSVAASKMIIGRIWTRACPTNQRQVESLLWVTFTSFPPSRRVRFAPRAGIRTMPAFMSTNP